MSDLFIVGGNHVNQAIREIDARHTLEDLRDSLLNQGHTQEEADYIMEQEG